MSSTVSGLMIMVFGAFFIGGAISFRQQKLPLLVQAILAIVGVALLGYGGYILLTY